MTIPPYKSAMKSAVISANPLLPRDLFSSIYFKLIALKPLDETLLVISVNPTVVQVRTLNLSILGKVRIGMGNVNPLIRVVPAAMGTYAPLLPDSYL